MSLGRVVFLMFLLSLLIGEDTMSNGFTEAIGKTLKNEGGLNLNELGRGGVSNFGITQQTLDEYNSSRGLPAEAVADMPKPKAQTILLEDFYQKPGFNRLPHRIGNQLFDYGVQSGPGTAIMAIQRVLGVEADGILGPITEKAIDNFISDKGETVLINGYLDERQEHFDRLTSGSQDFKNIKRGLDKRILKMRPKE